MASNLIVLSSIDELASVDDKEAIIKIEGNGIFRYDYNKKVLNDGVDTFNGWERVAGDNSGIMDFDIKISSLVNSVVEKQTLGKLAGIEATAGEIDALSTVNKNTFVIDGDSICAQNGYKLTGTAIYAESAGFFTWANVLLRNRMTLLANNGVGGERTDQLLGRLQASIDLNPRFIIINIGTNDVGQAVPVATIKANLLEIYNRINLAGIVCVMNTIAPRSTNTGSIVTDTFNVNNYLKSLEGNLKNFILVDTFSAIADPSTSLAFANMTTDGVHPSANGAYLFGKAIANKLDKYLPITDPFVGGNLDVAGSNLLNPCMLGGTDTATSWTLNINTGVGIKSKVARTNGLSWQQVDMTTFGDFNLYAYAQSFIVGTKYKAIAEYELDAGAVPDSYRISVQCKNGGTVLSSAEGLFIASGNAIRFPLDITSGIIETPVFTVPATLTSMPIFLSYKGTGKIRFGRCRLIKVD